MLKHLQALLVLLAFGLLLLLGTPVLDFQRWQDFDEPQELEAAAERYGRVGAAIAGATAAVNGRVRQPLYQLVAPIQRPLRAKQSWHLYRNGPRRVMRIEIRVDDRLVHRSSDPDHAWRSPQLRNRHLRPIVENVALKRDTPNWRGFTRWVVREARQDFPDAQQVEVVATSARFPGTDPQRRHFYRAQAPDWIPRQDGRQE